MTESDGDDASPVGPTHPGTKPPTRQREAGAAGHVLDIAVDEDDGQTVTLREPPSANRWWRNVSGRMVKSKQAREYQEAVEFELRGKVYQETGPVAIRVDWYRGRRSGDLDKRLGVLLDAMQGLLYGNDSQIVGILARRFDDPGNARVVVTITPVTATLDGETG